MAVPDEDDNQHDRHSTGSSTPPPLSINRLVALHSRERLLVHPLLWTDRQLQLLQCRIRFLGEAGAIRVPEEGTRDLSSPEQEPLRGRTSPHFPPGHPCDAHFRRLARGLGYYRMNPAIRELLRSVGNTISASDNLKAQFYFDRRPRAAIGYHHISYSTPGAEHVSFACYNPCATDDERRNHLYPPDRLTSRPNLPLVRRYRALLKRHKPPDRERDPYIVALIIALAQGQRSTSRSGRTAHSNLPASYTVRIVFAGQETPTPFNLYVAHVQDCFLARLDFPHRQPPANSGLDIDHWRISAEPFETLAQRLDRALRLHSERDLQDGGSVNGARTMIGEKRKRDVDFDTET